MLLHLSSVVIQALDAARVPVTTVTLHDLTAQIDLKAEYQRVKVRTVLPYLAFTGLNGVPLGIHRKSPGDGLQCHRASRGVDQVT